MSPEEAIPEPGLRERQKAERRQAISDAATALFVERGFDAVTLTEVAGAAGVSVKTILNYFGSKEELFLDREAEAYASTIAAISERAPGETITDGILRLLVDERVPSRGGGWEIFADPAIWERFRAFLATWKASPALRARHLLITERLADGVAEAVGAEHDLPAGDDRVRTMAAMLVAAMHLRHRVMSAAVLEGEPLAEVRRRVEAVAREALARVAAAFPDLDRRRPPGPAGPGGGAAGRG
jgi:AcrR family transcriptional regulator